MCIPQSDRFTLFSTSTSRTDKAIARLGDRLAISGCRWTPTRTTVQSLFLTRWWTAMEWRLGFRGLVLLLGFVVFLTSCADDSAPTRGVSPVPSGETLVFPRHDEAIPPNRGKQYVYGELSLSDNCLRISYFDQADPGGIRYGLLVVWPAGFDASNSGGVVEVTGADGSVVAAVGQTLRLSGRKVSRQSAAVDGWRWYGEDAERCGGPFWLVGDEVTAVGAGATGAPVAHDIVFPRLTRQRGHDRSPLVGMKGRLTLRGRCLLLETAHSPGEYFVVWPPGFNLHRTGDDLFILNGGGSVIAKMGDHVTLGGRSVEGGLDRSDECPGAYFMANSVRRSPVDPGG